MSSLRVLQLGRRVSTCHMHSTYDILSSLRGRGFAHVVVILIIKTFIQDRAKLCLPHNTIACFKGQLISKGLFDVIVWTEKPTKLF